MTEAIGENGAVRHLSPAGAPARMAEQGGAKPGAEVRTEARPPRSEGEEEPASSRFAESEPTLGTVPAGSQGIASASPSGAAAAALAGLATLGREKRREAETPLGPAGRTLEDIVRELLRPLLQAWLDDNLPGLVERLVREEIARVVREAGLR